VSRKRVLLGFSIIAGGVCASLPFLRETPLSVPSGDPVASPSPAPIVHLVQSPVATAAPTAPPLATESPAQKVPAGPSPYIDDGSQRLERSNPPGIATAAPLEEITASPKDKIASLPLLPVSFQVKQPDEFHAEPWQPAKLAEGPTVPAREYKIRKTDTLEDLALRFLGSADKAGELFEANRGVLKDRHILPLGAVIRIPAGGIDPPAESSETDLQPIGQPGN
jgi:nucleoid-associated protein YgaU